MMRIFTINYTHIIIYKSDTKQVTIWRITLTLLDWYHNTQLWEPCTTETWPSVKLPLDSGTSISKG